MGKRFYNRFSRTFNYKHGGGLVVPINVVMCIS